MECKGPVYNRQYPIHWKGYSHDWDTWERRGNLHPDTIKEFELQNNLYVSNWPHRCDVCDLPCRTEKGTKTHKRIKHNRVTKQQTFLGTLADRAVKITKWKDQQKVRPEVIREGKPIKNVFKFVYLGSVFSADDQQIFDIKARIVMAMKRCGQLRRCDVATPL